MSTFFSEDDRERAHECETVAAVLAGLVERGTRSVILIHQVDGEPAEKSTLAPALLARGFTPSSRGLMKRGARRMTVAAVELTYEDDE